MTTTHSLLLLVGSAFAVVIAVEVFRSERPVYPSGLRSASVLAAIAGFAWCVLGFTLYQSEHHLSHAACLTMEHYKALCAGFTAGVVITLLLFRLRPAYRDTSPTA